MTDAAKATPGRGRQAEAPRFRRYTNNYVPEMHEKYARLEFRAAHFHHETRSLL
jgi:hypothetical protein